MNTTFYNNNKNSSEPSELKTAFHDLNNLFNNLITGIQLLKESVKVDETNEKLFLHIENNANLASSIVAQISTNEKNFTQQMEVIDLNLLINDFLILIESDIKSNVEYVFNQSLGKSLVNGHYSDIKRILLNIVVNAKEALNNSGKIKIELHKAHQDQVDFIIVSVKDNGIGIPEELLENIFDNGFSTKVTDRNRGIGLPIAKKLMENHSGKIVVKSKFDVGSKFELWFPEFNSIKKQNSLENKKIIIAEDDLHQREVLKDLLLTLKINVLTASDGNEALELYYNNSPDLLFIDKGIPGLNGIECSNTIRLNNKSLPIVLLTGETIENPKEIEVVSKVLQKPYNFDDIQATLNELL